MKTKLFTFLVDGGININNIMANKMTRKNGLMGYKIIKIGSEKTFNGKRIKKYSNERDFFRKQTVQNL